MSVSITLPSDLEPFLQSHARRIGVPVETLLARTIADRWDAVRRSPALPHRESELLERLQTLFPAEQTDEYRVLCAQSDAGTLSSSDRERFLSLIEQRDYQNAARLEIVAEIAELRGVSLREAMASLEIPSDTPAAG